MHVIEIVMCISTVCLAVVRATSCSDGDNRSHHLDLQAQQQQQSSAVEVDLPWIVYLQMTKNVIVWLVRLPKMKSLTNVVACKHFWKEPRLMRV